MCLPEIINCRKYDLKIQSRDNFNIVTCSLELRRFKHQSTTPMSRCSMRFCISDAFSLLHLLYTTNWKHSQFSNDCLDDRYLSDRFFRSVREFFLGFVISSQIIDRTTTNNLQLNCIIHYTIYSFRIQMFQFRKMYFFFNFFSSNRYNDTLECHTTTVIYATKYSAVV